MTNQTMPIPVVYCCYARQTNKQQHRHVWLRKQTDSVNEIKCLLEDILVVSFFNVTTCFAFQPLQRHSKTKWRSRLSVLLLFYSYFGEHGAEWRHLITVKNDGLVWISTIVLPRLPLPSMNALAWQPVVKLNPFKPGKEIKPKKHNHIRLRKINSMKMKSPWLELVHEANLASSFATTCPKTHIYVYRIS